MDMKRWACGTGLAVLALLVGACVEHGIVEVSPDTYRLSRVDGGGVFADAAAMKASVVNEANAFAASKGKVAVPVSTREEKMRVGRLSTIEYEFKLVAPGEPTTAAAVPAQTAKGVADRPAAEVPPAGKTDSKPDLYTELIKLDELRRRGILTEEEFQMLKKRLLVGQ